MIWITKIIIGVLTISSMGLLASCANTYSFKLQSGPKEEYTLECDSAPEDSHFTDRGPSVVEVRCDFTKRPGERYSCKVLKDFDGVHRVELRNPHNDDYCIKHFMNNFSKTDPALVTLSASKMKKILDVVTKLNMEGKVLNSISVGKGSTAFGLTLRQLQSTSGLSPIRSVVCGATGLKFSKLPTLSLSVLKKSCTAPATSFLGTRGRELKKLIVRVEDASVTEYDNHYILKAELPTASGDTAAAPQEFKLLKTVEVIQKAGRAHVPIEIENGKGQKSEPFHLAFKAFVTDLYGKGSVRTVACDLPHLERELSVELIRGDTKDLGRTLSSSDSNDESILKCRIIPKKSKRVKTLLEVKSLTVRNTKQNPLKILKHLPIDVKTTLLILNTSNDEPIQPIGEIDVLIDPQDDTYFLASEGKAKLGKAVLSSHSAARSLSYRFIVSGKNERATKFEVKLLGELKGDQKTVSCYWVGPLGSSMKVHILKPSVFTACYVSRPRFTFDASLQKMRRIKLEGATDVSSIAVMNSEGRRDNIKTDITSEGKNSNDIGDKTK